MARIRAVERLAALDPHAPRERLISLILCGDVEFDGEVVRDPKSLVRPECSVEFHSGSFVSRGGLKLEHALDTWHIDPRGKVVVDAGASTGGFTDALLRHGAAAVHAVDVGYNQLDYRLRTDPRVHVHERTNIMDVTRLEPRPHFGVIDLSFRSLRGAARHTLELTLESFVVALLKPQFEWRDPPGSFDGRVPDDRVDSIVTSTLEGLREESLAHAELTESPIRGRGGNREFLVLLVSG